MSTTAAGTQGEQNESSILSAAEGPSSKTEARFYHVEIESDGGIPRALVATNTKWRFSVATFMLATTLGLKKIPMTPTQKQHPFETPFGVRYLRDYVPMRIRAPFIGINQSMLVHVGVLGSEETARGEHLFLGANFWKKVAQRKSEMESASMVARELLEPDERASTISPGIPEEPVERRDSSPTPIALITGIAPCGCPTSLCTLTDNMGPGVGTISDLDPERLGSHGTGRRSRPSRSTTRLEATSLFTHNHTSSTSILSSQSTHDMNVEHSYLEDSQNLTSEQPQVELRKGRFQRLSSVKEVDEAVEEIAKERLHAFSHSGSAAFSHTSSLTVDAKPSLLGGASDVLPHESFDFFNRAWLKAIKRMEEIDHQDFTITLPYGQEHQVDQLGSAGNPGNDVEHHNQQLLRENQPDRSSVSISTENESRGGFRSTQSPTVKQNHSGGSQISEESPESEGTRIRDNFDNTTPDICPLDGGVSTHQASWSDFRTTDDANIEGFETRCHLDPLPSIEINEEVADLPLGPLDTLQELAGQHERLRCLISEIKHSYPGSMTQDTYPKPFLADQLKLGLEALTRQKWEWWPFSEPNRPLKEGEVHLEWPCVGIPWR
ncbi:hypothetical protein GQ607_006827 [Colletotrichum asianum]|uniref:Uncharacterized protein n=1 Tax=Colletotrichum asianum TaxID=702518 RepID=A0A8H3WFD7_9PEZI|nr:hypothetical protein GQ607_006827 [Colletotrichum asianum]